MNETQNIEKKSITVLKTDLSSIAHTFVCLANSRGGRILIGIEDGDELPPRDQRIRQKDVDKVNKRIGELTYNVGISPQKVDATNGGEYIEVVVFPCETSIAST
jgi:ATP-dependent DNA helicase RecG